MTVQLGESVSTLGDVLDTLSYQGCSCAICRGMREDEKDPKNVLPNDASDYPVPETGGVNDAANPPQGVLLPLTRNPDGSYSITGNRNVDAALIGSKWAISNLTFSFPTEGSAYGTGYEDNLNQYHIDLGTLQQQSARAAFALISSYSGLTFTEITETDTVHANIRISQTGDNDVGSAQGMFPSDTRLTSGDIWFGRTNQPFYDLAVKGTWGNATMLHEIGHTMGLKHGHQDYTGLDLSFYFGSPPRPGTRALTPDNDGQAWSLMSYTPAPGTSGFAGDKANQPQSYMMYDIAALQYMYGANFNTNAGDTTYTWSETTGEMFVNGAGQGAPIENKVLLTVWDGGGVDTYDLRNYNNGSIIDLRPGQFTTLDSAQLANHLAYQNTTALAPGNVANALQYNNDVRSLIDNAFAGAGNDRLTGNQINNVLDGGAGNDRLDGGLGSDTLIGGAGSDTAVFSTASSVTVTLNDSGADVLVTHDGETDVLRGIENVVGTSGADTLSGNSQANVLEGNGGADTLNGGGGDDRLSGGGFTVGVGTPAPDKPDIVKPASTNNSSIATAIDTAGAYDLAPRSDVANSGTIPHATINATAAGGSLEYYRVDVQAGDVVRFDIDTNSAETDLDSWIELIDSAGEVLADNDFGASSDPGGTGNDDAQLVYTFATGGTYYIRVGQWTPANPPEPLPLSAGQTYTLHISLPSAPATPGTIVAINNSSAAMSGGDGNDFLQGTYGDDTFDGGAGVDTASFVTAYSATTAGVTVSLAASGVQNTGAAGNDTLVGIENLVGSAYSDVLTGDAAANSIEGGAGDDALDGAAGSDTASYAGATAAVTVSLAAQGAAQATGGAGSDTLTNFENLQGSAFNDRLSGDATVNAISGGAGDDVLSGNAAGAAQTGSDLLDGGAGRDVASFAGYSGVVVATLNGAFDAVATVGGVNQAVLRSIEGLEGGSASDRLSGDSGANILSGLGGNDDLSGQDGDDSIDGGAGDDIISGGAGSDTAVFSGSAAVTVDLRLTTAQNTGAGTDILLGIENLTGGSGDDTLIGDDNSNVFTDTGGNDTYSGNGGVDTVSYAGAAGAVNVSLSVVAAQNTGSAGGSDTLTNIENLTGSNFADTLVGNVNTNTLLGGAGSDRLTGGAGADVLRGGDGSDILIGDINDAFSSTPEGVATDGADVLEGGAGADILVGGLGDDVLRGGDGTDTLVTGLANVGAASLSSVYTNDGGNDTVDGGEGDDIVYAYYTGRAGAVSFDLANPSGNSAVTIGGAAAGSFTSIDRVIFRGGVAGDTVRGSAALDTLVGNEGDDVLDGWLGNDSLQGNAGNDTIIGGEGLDNLTFVNSTVGVTVDLRITTAQNTGEGLDTIREVEYLTGSAQSDTFNGTDDFNLIVDTLGGSDTIFAHGGNDTITITRAAALAAGTISLDGGAGNDVIQLNSGTLSATPAANAEGLSSGTGREFTPLGAVGSRYLDTVSVNAGDGNDRVVLTALRTATVDLGSGNDIVSISMLGAAGESAHTLTLGAGADTVQLGVTGVAVNNVAASTTARANVVNDFQVGDSGDRFEMTSFLNSSFLGRPTLSSNPFTSGHLRLVQAGADMLLQADRDGTGTVNDFVTLFTLKNTATGGFTAFNFDGFAAVLNLTGTSADDTLTGGELDDTLVGGDGDDVLKGLAGADTLDGGAGSDTADYSEKTTSVVVTLNGASDVTVTVNGAAEDTIRNIENVVGGSANDTLTGDAAANQLSGGLGNDTLDGGDGADTLNGNLGDDIVRGGGGEDTVIGGQGNDQVFGGADNDRLVGSLGDDVLNGGAGNDVLDGAGGTDTASYADAASGVTVNLGLSGQQATGGAGSDSLFAIENLEGSAFGDTLTGDAGANLINGLAGDDRLFGGDGADTINGGDGSDTINGNVGDDLINGNVGDDVIVGGQGNDRLIGGQGSDQLVGSLGDDILVGSIGADFLDGAGGADVFLYTAVNHSVVGSRDLISNFETGVDKVDLRGIRAGASDSFQIVTSGSFTLLNVDLGGDGVIDTQIAFANNAVVQAGDILFA